MYWESSLIRGYQFSRFQLKLHIHGFLNDFSFLKKKQIKCRSEATRNGDHDYIV